MFHLSKKVGGHLFIIFLLGGIFGVIDERNSGIDQFIGNGIAMIALAMMTGVVISAVISRLKISKQNIEEDKMLLDVDFKNEKEMNSTKYFTLNKYQCGVYVALFFVIFSFLGELKYYLSNFF